MPRVAPRNHHHAEVLDWGLASPDVPEWRNWQTQETQNLPPVTRRVGSIPSSGTILFNDVRRLLKGPGPEPRRPRSGDRGDR